MSWSLSLKNGDLFLGNGHGLETVTNAQKLTQDLRCHLLEKMGHDDLHPEFGSLLNGGIMTDGAVHPGFIGEINDEITLINIQSEINRVVNNYQTMTLNRAKTDRMTYGKATLSRGEVLYNLNDIRIENYFDQINVTINFTSADQTTQNLEVTI